MHQLSPDKIERLRGCLDSGMTSRATAKAVPCALNTVTNYRAAGATLSKAGALPAVIVPDQPPPTRHVDCGPCTACCHMAVFIGPWDTEEYELQPGTTILARRPETGACVYLDPQTGCTIYEHRPKACRAFACKTEAIKDEAIRRGLKKAEGQFWKLALSPPGESNRTDKSRLLAVLGISESEYVARFTSVTHTDWVMRCTARKVPRAAEQEPVVLPPSKRAA